MAWKLSICLCCCIYVSLGAVLFWQFAIECFYSKWVPNYDSFEPRLLLLQHHIFGVTCERRQQHSGLINHVAAVIISRAHFSYFLKGDQTDNLVHCVISQDCWEEEEEATPKLQLIEWVMSAFKKWTAKKPTTDHHQQNLQQYDMQFKSTRTKWIG